MNTLHIPECQAKYLERVTKKKKKHTHSLSDDKYTLYGDFTENHQFMVQDEIQAYHWSKESCILHPIVMHFKQDIKLHHQSLFSFRWPWYILCAWDAASHIYFHQNVARYHYFGCHDQYKNYKNILKVCLKDWIKIWMGILHYKTQEISLWWYLWQLLKQACRD